MPIFDYQCKKCEHVFEKMFLKVSAVEETIDCEKCGEHAANQLIGAPQFELSKTWFTGKKEHQTYLEKGWRKPNTY